MNVGTQSSCLKCLLQLKYRDRAKERRDKYGSPAIVPGWKKRLEREMASADSEPPIPLVFDCTSVV